MPNRIIKVHQRNQSTQLTACLSSLIALELMHPSPEMFLTSPWITDTPILDNTFGQFRPFLPNAGTKTLGLKEVLTILSERGSKVKIMTSHSDINRDFLAGLPDSIQVKKILDLHEKGWVTNRFYLRGSMNFTYSGVNLNDENIELTTDDQEVRFALTEARHKWGIS